MCHLWVCSGFRNCEISYSLMAWPCLGSPAAQDPVAAHPGATRPCPVGTPLLLQPVLRSTAREMHPGAASSPQASLGMAAVWARGTWLCAGRPAAQGIQRVPWGDTGTQRCGRGAQGLQEPGPAAPHPFHTVPSVFWHPALWGWSWPPQKALCGPGCCGHQAIMLGGFCPISGRCWCPAGIHFLTAVTFL